MHIIDLNTTEANIFPLQSEVCIIGAGAAGLYLAVRLAELGMDIIVLEAGDKTCVDGETLGLETLFGEQYYSGATAGRFFGLGGSTSKWGGALVPHVDADADNSIDDQQAVWAHIVNQVKQHTGHVLQTLGFEKQPDFGALGKRYFPDQAQALERAGLSSMSALFLPFKHKNFATLLERKSSASGNLTLILNAVATQWKWKGERMEVCIAQNRQKKQVDIRSNQFVIAAGAIESARILLEIRRQSEDRLLKENEAIGRYLSDHLSSHVADVQLSDWSKVAALFGPRFLLGDMRSFRFMEKSKPPEMPRSFFHFIFDIDNPGFALAKKVLSGIQSKTIPHISFSELKQGIISTGALGYARYAQKRLRIPPGTPAHLQLDMEQTPSFDNKIELTGGKDAYGRPRSIIHWKIEDEDYRKIENTTLRFLNKWPKDTSLPGLHFHKSGTLGLKPHDAYHPVGTCRMGEQKAVVGMDLKVQGLGNVFVLSTAVFPTAGSANPTFSMLCLGEQLAQHLHLKQEKA